MKSAKVLCHIVFIKSSTEFIVGFPFSEDYHLYNATTVGKYSYVQLDRETLKYSDEIHCLTYKLRLKEISEVEGISKNKINNILHKVIELVKNSQFLYYCDLDNINDDGIIISDLNSVINNMSLTDFLLKNYHNSYKRD